MLRLIDIAAENVSCYQAEFDSKPDNEKLYFNSYISSLGFRINMYPLALLNLLNDRWKNCFELCAEANSMSIEEFGNLPLKQQSDILCKNISNEKKFFRIRRVDFSNRYENGLLLNYLALDMSIYKTNPKYGNLYVEFRLPSSKTDVILKYDSLLHYYNEQNEYNEDSFNKDLLPIDNKNLLIACKYSESFQSIKTEEIKNIINDDVDPCEIMTTTKLDASTIDSVKITLEDYKKILKLSKDKAISSENNHIRDEILQNFLSAQYKMSRLRIKFEIIEEADYYD